MRRWRLGAIGSILGCSAGGQAACGAMLDVESGYGRLVGLSALPSSQTIYGIVVMLSLNRTVDIAIRPGTVRDRDVVRRGVVVQRLVSGQVLCIGDPRDQEQARGLRFVGSPGGDRRRLCRVCVYLCFDLGGQFARQRREAFDSMENSSSNRTSAQTESADVGVQQLIDRLKSEGVEEGKQQAEALLTAAKQEAAAIVDAARAEADTIVRGSSARSRTHRAQRKTRTGASQPRCEPATEGATRTRVPRLDRRSGSGATRYTRFLALVIREMAAQCSDVLGEATGEQETSPAGKIKILVAQTEQKTTHRHAN